MKYLLNFLDDVTDAPNISDPNFQQLLVDVQSVKGATKIAADVFYDSLENIINELKTSPESIPFQKPVSKRDAPDYYDVIKKPMDLSTVLRNVKARKYKNKSEFAGDIDQIWRNCYEYNSQETHPLRAAARFMKQKSDHHLQFLADRTERTRHLESLLPSVSGTTSPSIQLADPSIGPAGALPRSRIKDEATSADEDAAGESDDAFGEGDAMGEVDTGTMAVDTKSQDFREGGADMRGERDETPVRVGKDGQGRGTSVASSSRMTGRVNGMRSPPVRPVLSTSLEHVPALLRTPYTIPSLSCLSLVHAGPSSFDKGKAREIIQGQVPPPWYPIADNEEDDEESILEGSWWATLASDEAYLTGLPSVPVMEPSGFHKLRIPRPSPLPPLPDDIASDNVNGDIQKEPEAFAPSHPPVEDSPSDTLVSVKSLVRRTVHDLNSSRHIASRIADFQRVEAEGGVLPSRTLVPSPQKREMEEEERAENQARRRAEREAVQIRRERGAEVGQDEAVNVMRRCAAGMLAHAGFEGASETALDMFTRVTVDHLDGIGKTFRLLIDGFSNKMSPEEIVLHALHENGQIEPRDLESHLKDDILRDGAKIKEMHRKMRQAFYEIATAPVIEDDMMFADDGEMMVDGNFADELGEDFLGLRELGIDREFGLSSLTVPQTLFYGRKKRLAESRGGSGKSGLQYPPPPPFVPLSASTLHTHIPALLHAFFAARMEAGISLGEDDPFEASHAQIGSLGQIIAKGKSGDSKGNSKGKAKKREREGDDGEQKKSGKKISGVGKGNWVRPSKGEPKHAGIPNGEAGEEDAEGEEES